MSIGELDPNEVIWFVECLKHPHETFYTHTELEQRTKKLVRALPKYLRNPMQGAAASQSTLTAFCAKIGASPDTLPQSSYLCEKHSALSGQLTASIRSLCEYVAEDLSEDVIGPLSKDFVLKFAEKETLTLFHHAENIMAYTLTEDEFRKSYRRESPSGRKIIQCDACFITELMEDTDTICGLRGIALEGYASGMSDDSGINRAGDCKMLFEAMLANHPASDILLLMDISDKMAKDLDRLAQFTVAQLQANELKGIVEEASEEPIGHSTDSLMPAPLNVKKSPEVLNTLRTTFCDTENDCNELSAKTRKILERRNTQSSSEDPSGDSDGEELLSSGASMGSKTSFGTVKSYWSNASKNDMPGIIPQPASHKKIEIELGHRPIVSHLANPNRKVEEDDREQPQDMPPPPPRRKPPPAPLTWKASNSVHRRSVSNGEAKGDDATPKASNFRRPDSPLPNKAFQAYVEEPEEPLHTPLTARPVNLTVPTQASQSVELESIGEWQKLYKAGKLPFSLSHTSSIGPPMTPSFRRKDPDTLSVTTCASEAKEGLWDRAHQKGVLPFPMPEDGWSNTGR